MSAASIGSRVRDAEARGRCDAAVFIATEVAEIIKRGDLPPTAEGITEALALTVEAVLKVSQRGGGR